MTGLVLQAVERLTISQKEDGSVVGDNIPVAFVSAELD